MKPNPTASPVFFPTSGNKMEDHDRPASLHHPLNPYRPSTPPKSQQTRLSVLDVSALSQSNQPDRLLRLRFETQKPGDSGRVEDSHDLFNRIRPGYVMKHDFRTPDASKDYRVSATLISQPGRVLYRYRPNSLEELLRPNNTRIMDQDRVCRYLYSFLSLQEINLLQSVIPLAERVIMSKPQPFKDPFCLQRIFEVGYVLAGNKPGRLSVLFILGSSNGSEHE